MICTPKRLDWGLVRVTRLLALLILWPAIASAQQAVLSGTVKTTTGEPVRGAFVIIQSLSLGTLTNDAGFYRLQIPEGRATGTAQLQVQSIGFRNADVTVQLRAGAMRQDVTLVEEAVAMREVVVTGTMGRQERRAQAAVVAKIDATRVAEVAPVNSVANMLQARVAGVSISQGSGSVGTGQRIRIRGVSSIS
ncbi:MAG TPA: carboxypeptidase-like regulatory domain-containing protein, partial [Longimicrobiales bacterium]|nr:carboxypeptidase-like regulatory domain-containing protein [Longimicrobiales bacterium]